MKISTNNTKILYFAFCFILSLIFTGCKEKVNVKTVFNELPDSIYVQQAKDSLKDKKPIAIAFTAEWCPHCKQYKPIFSEVKNSFPNQATFINIDVDDENGGVLSDRFQVQGIPTTAFVRADGSLYKVEVGEIESERLKKIITDLIASKKKGKSDPIAPFPIEKEDVKKTEPKVETKVEPSDVAPQEIITEPVDIPPQEIIKEGEEESHDEDGNIQR